VRVSGHAITKRFGAITALQEIDIELETHDAVAILGPNGAGKSTLLRILAGLARPTSGRLEISCGESGATLSRSRAAARSLVGFAGHATFLYPELTARENLVFHARLHGVTAPHARADVLLADEGLSAVADRRAGTFSRGMAQRLAIARALIQDPPLILLDEPFTGLDRRSGDRLSRRLAGLRDEGRAVVLVTHDLLRASEIADRALVLLAGRIVEQIEGPQVASGRLEHAYARALDTASARALDANRSREA
jgi:heme exporter protein A